MPSAPQQPLSKVVIFAALVASALVAGFAISQQSYWIDEALSVIAATAQTPVEAWRYLCAVSGSTIQMPAYQIYLYAWHKFFGVSEWAMRASNIPWFLLGQFAFLSLLRNRPKLALMACLLAVGSPFLWMYLDETRPYIMQYAAGCWMIAALLQFLYPLSEECHTTGILAEKLPLIPLSLATLILFASSLLGIVWGVSFVAALWWVIRTAPHQTISMATLFKKRPFQLLAIILIAFTGLVLAIYYAWTWNIAQRGYHHAPPSLLSLPFLAYEFLGFSGFGPSKFHMRLEPVRSILQSWPAFLPLTAIFASLGLFALFQLRRHTPTYRILTTWALALAFPTMVILTTFLLLGHRPLPRHFIPILPAIILGLAALINLAFSQKSLFWKIIAALLPLLWLGSSLNLRWNPIYAKDDYRSAAAIATSALADHKEVWWAADAAAAYVYKAPVALEEIPGRIWAIQSPTWESIRFKFPPHIIIISKPDIYDVQGAVMRYAEENQFAPAVQFQAFTILTRHGKPVD